MLRALRVVAYLRFREAISYRWLSGQAVLAPLLEVAFLFFLSRLVPDDGADLGVGYFEFALIGVAAMNLVSGCVQSAHQYLRSLQLTGVLAWYCSTPVGLIPLMLANAVTGLGLPFFRFAANLGLGALLGAEVGLCPTRLFLFTGCVCLAVLPLSLASQCWLLRFKKGDPVGLGVSASALLFCGVYFPVSVLPEGWKIVSFIIPTTHLAELARWSLAVKPVDVTLAVGALLIWCFAVGGLLLLVVQRVATNVRQRGHVADY